VGGLLQPSPAEASVLPFIDPPSPMQRLARGVGAGVQILKLFPEISMEKFKNRLTAAKAEIIAAPGPRVPQTLKLQRAYRVW